MKANPTLQRLFQKLENDPNSKAFVPLAELYLQSDLFEEALEILAEGIARHPTYVAALMMRGKMYLQKKRIYEAKDDFKAVLETHPENIQAYKYLIHIYREMGKLEDAVMMCNKILTLDPRDKATERLMASIQEEIAVTQKIATLAPLSALPTPEKTPEERSPLAETLSASDSPSEGFSLEPVMHTLSTDPSNSIPDPLTAPRRERLQMWLSDIQERRKTDDLS